MLLCSALPLLAFPVVSRMSDSDDENGDSAKLLPAALRSDPDAKTYLYRDFANLPESLESDNSPPTKRGNSESSIRVQKFPVKVSSMTAELSAKLIPPRCALIHYFDDTLCCLLSSTQFSHKGSLVTLSPGCPMDDPGKCLSPISLKVL